MQKASLHGGPESAMPQQVVRLQAYASRPQHHAESSSKRRRVEDSSSQQSVTAHQRRAAEALVQMPIPLAMLRIARKRRRPLFLLPKVAATEYPAAARALASDRSRASHRSAGEVGGATSAALQDSRATAEDASASGTSTGPEGRARHRSQGEPEQSEADDPWLPPGEPESGTKQDDQDRGDRSGESIGDGSSHPAELAAENHEVDSLSAGDLERLDLPGHNNDGFGPSEQQEQQPIHRALRGANTWGFPHNVTFRQEDPCDGRLLRRHAVGSFQVVLLLRAGVARMLRRCGSEREVVRVLSHCHRLLPPGGVLLLEVPTGRWLRSWQRRKDKKDL